MGLMVRVSWTVVMSVLVVACGASDGGTGAGVSMVSIDQVSQSLEVGESVTLTATVTSSGGASEAVEWSSGDQSVATVTSNGAVTALSGGDVSITATSVHDPSKSDSVEISVPEAMVLVFDTTRSDGTTVELQLHGAVDVVVDWGDGEADAVGAAGALSHTYASEGTYVVEIAGSLSDFGSQSYSSVAQAKLIAVESWGDLRVVALNGAFLGSNITEVPGVLPPSVTSMRFAFANAEAFDDDISQWDVSGVTTLLGLFFGASAFDQDLSSWDVSNVTSMAGTFAGATLFNADISGWDVSGVTEMQTMFSSATAFDQDISGWDVSGVTNMEGMFNNGTFDQDIGAWDVSSVTNMEYMFSRSAFNRDIGAWDVSNVTDMEGMFREAAAFDQDLSSWCVPSIDTAPLLFDDGASSWVLPRPAWGTCP